ncbi:hypothetical protein NDU88_002497 [Pleurodeles waltl]|uniref:Uncharacterized protein n=1 Tax=Pleurodeles waltl TaxID=8319 RepID=A0AAV7LCH7_PLEWA|nr:hypothetical protein NDU88_002497 [Pleurodeles waltl]
MTWPPTQRRVSPPLYADAVSGPVRSLRHGWVRRTRSLAAHRSSQAPPRADTDPRPGLRKRAGHPAVWIREGPSLIRLLRAAESRIAQWPPSLQVDLT